MTAPAHAPVPVTYEDTGHTGRDALSFVHRLLMIDEEWTSPHDDGFTWWAHRLAQRYRWEGPLPVDGIPTWFLSVETDFLRDVHDHDEALAFANRANDTLELGVGALVVERDLIRVRSRTYAMPESAEERARWLASCGIIANAVASTLADIHAHDPRGLGLFGLDPIWLADASEHPICGPRDEPDEMLTVIRRVYQPHGARPAAETVILGLDDAVHGMLAAGATAFGGDAIGALRAHWAVPYGRLRWTLARAFEHHVLGFCAFSRLVIVPKPTGPQATHDVAQRLNAAEHHACRPLIGGGAWCATTDGDRPALAYTTVVPNHQLRSGLAPLLAWGARVRADGVGDGWGDG